MDAVEQAKSGHPGMPMGMADVATVLFRDFLSFDPSAPDWADRDRFVLSAGHGSMLLYALLHLTGYPAMTLEELKRFRQLGSRTPGHPEFERGTGIETTTGPLGQGFGNAVGMALAERLLAARFGDAAVDHWTYVVVGDGCLMEGISHEAASLAGHLQLGKLVALYDDNEISIDGPTSLALSDDALMRFQAYNWHTQRVDGHDPAAIRAAIEAARADERPSLIACRTRIGFGAPTKEGSAASHGSPLGAEEIAGAREKLGWPHGAFEVPAPVLEAWRAIGARGAERHQAWTGRIAALATEERAEFERRLSGAPPAALGEAFRSLKAQIDAERPTLATRQSSQRTIEAIAGLMPELLGGSADLTGSNNTKTKAQEPVVPPGYGGS
ncbi:MAG: thiamine pyrophosphate-dependent enzyme, partial [Tistlia sp.]